MDLCESRLNPEIVSGWGRQCGCVAVWPCGDRDVQPANSLSVAQLKVARTKAESNQLLWSTLNASLHHSPRFF
ncbi:hypothetical protein RRG08_059463 [Elysia crispata]|uniref:Uncharacterized protein n=1 Tax=Elysia crispata TaxID=231223 RepID=A0AAE1A3T5_9GAST|nr:hypothetical protein RRG08_059463 [Elysia crispata]